MLDEADRLMGNDTLQPDLSTLAQYPQACNVLISYVHHNSDDICCSPEEKADSAVQCNHAEKSHRAGRGSSQTASLFIRGDKMSE